MTDGAGSARTDRFFDDRSRYVDRFGWLLALTATTVVLLSLIDLDTIPANTARWSTIVVTALVAATLSLALRASGTTRRWQRVVDVLLALGLVATVVVVLATSTTTGAASLTAAPAALVLLAAIAPQEGLVDLAVRGCWVHGVASQRDGFCSDRTAREASIV